MSSHKLTSAITSIKANIKKIRWTNEHWQICNDKQKWYGLFGGIIQLLVTLTKFCTEFENYGTTLTCYN